MKAGAEDAGRPMRYNGWANIRVSQPNTPVSCPNQIRKLANMKSGTISKKYHFILAAVLVKTFFSCGNLIGGISTINVGLKPGTSLERKNPTRPNIIVIAANHATRTDGVLLKRLNSTPI